MRFIELNKVQNQPGLRLLALANAKLQTKLNLPPDTSVIDMLNVLAKEEAYIDILRLMAAALPVREGIWWACLAGRDIVGENETPRTLETAEAWVRKPNNDTRDAAKVALDAVDVDDPTALCAMAVTFHDGNLGTGDLADFPAPPGAAATAIFGMNAEALNPVEDFKSTVNFLIDRGIDIANGGTGNVEFKQLELAQ